MLTKILNNRLDKIIAFIDKHSGDDFSCESMELIDTIWQVKHLLEIAPESYRELSEEDLKEGYYFADCDKCGWFGSSKLLEGGHSIADTGDYSDVYCPVCGNNDF